MRIQFKNVHINLILNYNKKRDNFVTIVKYCSEKKIIGELKRGVFSLDTERWQENWKKNSSQSMFQINLKPSHNSTTLGHIAKIGHLYRNQKPVLQLQKNGHIAENWEKIVFERRARRSLKHWNHYFVEN